MKIILTLTCILLMSSMVYAVDYQTVVYPEATQVNAVTTTVADTITVTIQNLATSSIAGFFLTVHSDDSVYVLGSVIDGNTTPTYTTEVSYGTIYPSQLVTCMVIGAVTDSIKIKFYTTNLENMHFSFCGQQPEGFFGVADPQPVLPDCCIGIRGNIDNDASGMLDIADLVYLVEYSFGNPSGPAPVCFEEADVDASGELDISDIVHVVNYMFSVGESVPPANCP